MALSHVPAKIKSWMALSSFAILAFVFIFGFQGIPSMKDISGNLNFLDLGKQVSSEGIQGLQKEYSSDTPVFFDISVTDPKFQIAKDSYTFATFVIRDSNQKQVFALPAVYQSETNAWTDKWFQIMKPGEYEMVFQFQCMEAECVKDPAKRMMERSQTFKVIESKEEM